MRREVDQAIFNQLEDQKFISVDQLEGKYPNEYLEINNKTTGKSTLVKLSPDLTKWTKLTSKTISGIKARNKEQAYLVDALLDTKITSLVVYGPAGSGKTLIALAYALSGKKKYDRTILTRPMSEVGKYKLGALPGDTLEKFGPFLVNYTTNLGCLMPGRKLEDLMNHMDVEVVPIQLMRGASFMNCLILADEVQVLGRPEILTIGTRVGENSKIILMGDLDQRDEKIKKEDTGLYHLIHSEKFLQSPLSAVIELKQIERGATAALFAEVFKDLD